MKAKRIVISVLALALVFGLAACGAKAEPAFADVSSAVDSAAKTDAMTPVDSGYIKGMMGLDSDAYTDAEVLVTSSGTAIDEYGVFKAADAKGAEAVKTAVEAYIQQRIDTWMGYTPEELPKLEDADVTVQGSYVLYTILGQSETAAAQTAFLNKPAK